MGVTSARVFGDSSLELTLVDGVVQLYEPDDFVILGMGTIADSEAIVVKVLALANAAGAISGTAAGLLAAAAATGVVAAVEPQIAAKIGGAITELVSEDATSPNLTASGTLTVSGAGPGEAVFAAQAATSGSNGSGTLMLSASGCWPHAADNMQLAIQALGDGETLTDSFTAVTADSTTEAVTVTITLVNTGRVTEDTGAGLKASGALTVSNTDADLFVAQAGMAGSNGYGSFTLSQLSLSVAPLAPFLWLPPANSA